MNHNPRCLTDPVQGFNGLAGAARSRSSADVPTVPARRCVAVAEDVADRFRDSGRGGLQWRERTRSRPEQRPVALETHGRPGLRGIRRSTDTSVMRRGRVAEDGRQPDEPLSDHAEGELLRAHRVLECGAERVARVTRSAPPSEPSPSPVRSAGSSAASPPGWWHARAGTLQPPLSADPAGGTPAGSLAPLRRRQPLDHRRHSGFSNNSSQVRISTALM
jgi:hypothetical protein